MSRNIHFIFPYDDIISKRKTQLCIRIKRFIAILSLCMFFYGLPLTAQSLYPAGQSNNETVFYTMNKQVNQFVHRFNMEEDQYGKMLDRKDKRYHNNNLRKKFLPFLFDIHNPRTSGKLKNYFIDDVTNAKHPVYLNFLDKNWYAEVSTTFLDENGKPVNLILFLTLEQAGQGSKWIISNVYDTDLKHLFPVESTKKQAKYFLHPQSHEIDFMNLHKALNNPDDIEYYASTGFRPDYLSLFFYLMKKRKLSFKQINEVKFHFFQIKNWYFELKYFNRNENNSGWLISNLKYLSDDEKANLIKFYRSCTTDL